MTENTNAQAIIDVAIASAIPNPLDSDGRFFNIVTPGGDSIVIDVEAERTQLLDHPRRKTGSYTVHDGPTFAAYLNKHGDTYSEVWADFPQQRLVGVVNAHGDQPGHEDHRLSYAVVHTPAWKAWATGDGKLFGQQEFAEHIEDRAVDIVDPAAADMLELAQTFQATTGVEFQSSQRLSSGEAQLTYRETVEAKAGKAGRLDIPQAFSLAIQPFHGAETYKVKARLRYRIADGTLRLGYKIERPEDVLRDAFTSVVDGIAQDLQVPIWSGAR